MKRMLQKYIKVSYSGIFYLYVLHDLHKNISLLFGTTEFVEKKDNLSSDDKGKIFNYCYWSKDLV